MLFEKIVCLNLDHRLSDGERLERLFRFTGVPFERFVVGKGTLLTPRMYSRVDEPHVSSLWAAGQYRHLPNSYHAFAAYQHIIQNAYARGTRSVLLLEDDADLASPDTFERDLAAIEAEITRQDLQCDMLYLGCNHTWSTTIQVAPNLLKTLGGVCFHAVILRESVFKDILDFVPIKPIDTTVAERLHTKYNCLAAWPNLVIQKPGYSHVEGKNRDYSDFWACKGNPALCS